ncbi:MAG: TlpA disulfide reductase family protein [Spirochaetia bacterium]|jgi:peroxiredoxin|nr:TlpA disulfide reductase family protein [Spirochaetia bacterium]
MKKIIIILSLMTLIVAFLPAQDAPPMTPLQEKLWRAGFGVPQQIMDAPEFSAENLEGKQISLSSQKGKVILLNLWATWCPPCRAEMPSMERLYQKLNDPNFTILAIATPTPPKETREKIIDFVDENGYTFPVLIDDSKEISYQYGSGSIPTSWIIDAEGKVLARFVGAMEWDSELMLEVFEELIP